MFRLLLPELGRRNHIEAATHHVIALLIYTKVGESLCGLLGRAPEKGALIKNATHVEAQSSPSVFSHTFFYFRSFEPRDLIIEATEGFSIRSFASCNSSFHEMVHGRPPTPPT